MRKPIIRILLSVLLVVVVAVGGTLAYLVASDSPLLNTFALMHISTEIEEEEAGTAADKKPVVRNTGTADVYVRAYAYVVMVGEDGNEYVDPDLSQYVVPQYNTTYWTEKDGYYYYTGTLAPTNATEPLFNGVNIDTDHMPTNQSFRVYVYQEGALVPSSDTGDWDITKAEQAFTTQTQAD